MFGQIHRHLGIAKHADIHFQHPATRLRDHPGQKIQLVLFGVISANQQNHLGHHKAIHAVFRSVNLSTACSDLSLPLPDCFMPVSGTVISGPP